MLKKIYLLIVFCLLMTNLSAQIAKFNGDWQFQRLDRETSKSAIENQGTSWESQYNVTHTAVKAELTVPQDTLIAELKILQAGIWEGVTLPHTPKIEDFVVLHQWQGICYYKKNIKFDSSWMDKQIWMEFEGAMHLADIWINGKHITQHAGGYTPFVIDLTSIMHRDKPNEILVRLDNRDNPLIPPGKPLNKLDFCYYGGIYRNVNVILKPKDVYISHPIMADQVAGGGVFVTYPEVSEKSAIVNIKTHVVNDSKSNKNLTVRQKLFSIDGLYGKGSSRKEVSQKEDRIQLKAKQNFHQSQDIKVENPTSVRTIS